MSLLNEVPSISERESWNLVGGSLTIPDGHFITEINCDADEPYLKVCKENEIEELTIPVPKPLAYFLSTQGWASWRLRNMAFNDGVRHCQERMRSVLGL